MEIFCPPALKELANSLSRPLYIVGGYIRNQLCGLAFDSADIDICGPFPSAEFLLAGAKAVPVNKKLGTAQIRYKGAEFEYTQFRRESYGEGGAHSPERVEFTQSLNEDAKRRDFTANSIYYDINSSRIEDVLGGIEDTKNRILRANDPDFVFASDGLRLMRLVRFAAELGFAIDGATHKAAAKKAAMLRDIAAERKRDELDKILYADLKHGLPDAHYQGLKHLTDIRLWPYILPCMMAMDIPQNPKYHKHSVLQHTLLAVKYAEPPVRLAALMHDTGKPVSQEKYGNMHAHATESAEIVRRELGQTGLKYPSKIVEETAELCLLHMCDLNAKTSDAKMRLFAAENFDFLDKLQLLAECDGKATGQEQLYTPRFLYFKRLLIQENAPVRVTDLKIDGRDAVNAGYTGAEIARVLEQLLRECIINPALNNRDWLLNQLEKIADQFTNN